MSNLIEKGVVLGSEIKAVIARYTVYQSIQADGTRLDMMYISSDHDALLINYQDNEIIQANLVLFYTPAFGNPFPFIKRKVISMDGLTSFEGLADISVTTDYMALEAEVERQREQAASPSKAPKQAVTVKDKPLAVKTKPTLKRFVPAAKIEVPPTDCAQPSLF